MYITVLGVYEFSFSMKSEILHKIFYRTSQSTKIIFLSKNWQLSHKKKALVNMHKALGDIHNLLFQNLKTIVNVI